MNKTVERAFQGWLKRQKDKATRHAVAWEVTENDLRTAFAAGFNQARERKT